MSSCKTCSDLLTPIIDPMYLLEPLPCDDDFNFGDSRRTSGSLVNVEEYVDPQYTVKPYGIAQLGFMTPETSPTDTACRHDSIATSYFRGSSAASSFMSHSGGGTTPLTTPDSSASNSRRQSLLLPEGQQYYLSPHSSSPSDYPHGPKKVAATDQCSLEESSTAPYLANTNAVSLNTDGAAACLPESGFTMVVDDFTGKASRQWHSYSPETASSPLYRTLQPAQIDESTNWSCDLVAKVDSSMAARTAQTFEFNPPLFGHGQSTIFPLSQPVKDAYSIEGNSSPNTPSLAPPFELGDVKYHTDIDYADHDMVSDVTTTGISSFVRVFRDLPPNDKVSPPSDDDLERRPAHPRSHNKKNRAAYELGSYKLESRTKSHRCREPDCSYACNRPEHLRRHENSKHMKENTEWLPCEFHGCIDPKHGKQRKINSRQDNLKMHYTKTHFKYGASEKGGKNDRKSMKVAHEMGLNVYDHRWTLLLGNQMDVNSEIEDNLHVWKMLGYSILETKNTKVKDLAPECKVPEDKTLQEYDPRWKALWDGTLTFDKAMNVGKHMKESEAQWLLGVTMLETEAMGIKHLDPRWTMMLSGRMSVEQSEKLGVKQRNPAWKDSGTRRRAR